MKIYSTILIVLALLLANIHAQTAQCNTTTFDFTGVYSLGKQDELNRTFTKIQQKITVLSNVSFKLNETTSYTIFNAKPIFFYRDSAQRSSIAGNDTVIIFGGKLEVSIDFQWSKKTNVITRNGTGSCFGLSDEIDFAKRLVIDEGQFYSFTLQDNENVTWSNGQVFKLNRIEPADASDEDKATLTRMLNNIMSVTTIRLILEDEIDKYFSYYLNNSLHDQHQPINNHFDYTWTRPGKPDIIIPFSRRPITVDLQKSGLSATFEAQAINSTTWKCGNRSLINPLPLNPSVYGASQQFLSYDFYQNTLRHAISQGLLDTDLTRQNWASRMFQFFTGDIYDIFPNLQTRFYASEPVTGNCKATFTGLKIWKANYDTFNVSIHFDCELNILRQKILDFSVGLQAQIQGIPRASTLDFKFRAHEEFISFYQYGDYKMQNHDLAVLMIKHCLNRNYETVIFGSGWPMSPPRDYPHFIAEQNYTIVYDSTHVDPHTYGNQIPESIKYKFDLV